MYPEGTFVNNRDVTEMYGPVRNNSDCSAEFVAGLSTENALTAEHAGISQRSLTRPHRVGRTQRTPQIRGVAKKAWILGAVRKQWGIGQARFLDSVEFSMSAIAVSDSEASSIR